LEQVRQLFAGPDSEKNAQNFERLVTASKNTVDRFLTRYESHKSKEHKEIAAILRAKWDTPETTSVTHYIRRDLKSDFWPAQNRERYPDDEKTYGHKVDAKAWSPSFAHTQFVPRRERLGPDSAMDTPVSGVFEFRMPNHAGNQKLEAHFARSKKRPRNALEQSWTAFEAHVDLVQKKRKFS